MLSVDNVRGKGEGGRGKTTEGFRFFNASQIEGTILKVSGMDRTWWVGLQTGYRYMLDLGAAIRLDELLTF